MARRDRAGGASGRELLDARRAAGLRAPRRSRRCPAASGSGSRSPGRSRPRPRLLLLDEPLSALDRALRERLAVDLRAALVATGTTALFVTHDQDEAFAVADRVAVMDAGRLLQVDAPADAVAPAGVAGEVAEFLGYEAFVPLRQPRRRARCARPLGVPAVARRRSRSPRARSSSAASGVAKGTVRGVSSRRGRSEVRVEVDGIGVVTALGPVGGSVVAPGDVVELGVDPDAIGGPRRLIAVVRRSGYGRSVRVGRRAPR